MNVTVRCCFNVVGSLLALCMKYKYVFVCVCVNLWYLYRYL